MHRAAIPAFFLTMTLLGAWMPSLAQELPGTDPLSLVITPEYPRPGQEIRIAPRSNLVDLSASRVRISVNGTQIYEGSGTQAATARTGGLGERTTVILTVTDPGGQTYTKQQVLRPAEVSLALEPVSTMHPFYRGGGLVASEGGVRLVAIADLRTSPGSRLPASGLVYTWRLGERILTDASGIGRSTLAATAPVRYRNADISVTVTSPDNALVGQASTRVSAVDPVARIYRNDPLLGPNFDVALADTFTLPDTEATFRAVGYFFAVPPSYAWTVGGRGNGSDKDLTVRATGGQGTARLGVSATETASKRTADAALTVNFGADTGFGFFGL